MGCRRKGMGIQALIVFLAASAAFAQEDDSGAPDVARTEAFDNSEGTGSASLEERLELSEAALDVAPTAMELLRSTPKRSQEGKTMEAEMDGRITPEEAEDLHNAEALKRREEGPARWEPTAHSTHKPAENLIDTTFEPATSLGRATEFGNPATAHDALVAATAPSKMQKEALNTQAAKPCLGLCAIRKMHDSFLLRKAAVVARYQRPSGGMTPSVDAFIEMLASNKTSGANSTNTGACCPCSGGAAGNTTNSSAVRRLLTAPAPAPPPASPSGGGGVNASSATGGGKCCPCSHDKEVTLTLNMDKPASAAEMKKFEDAFKKELTSGMKLENGRVTFSAQNSSMAESMARDDTTELGEDLGTALAKFVVRFNIKKGNTTKVVNTMKKDLSNPTSPLARGKLLSRLDKTAGMSVKTVETKSACATAVKKWSYKDPPSKNGPANWKKKYPKCGLPGVQSPVRLPLVTPKKATVVFRRLDFDYKAVKLTLMNDGRNLMAMVPPGSTFRVSGQAGSSCQLQYVVFHSPSEHVFTDANGNDIRYAAEMQLHHRSADGRLVVVAVLFKVNAPNPFVAKMFKKIPKKCQSTKIADELKFEDILPFSRTYYMYYGTITSPPCTDTVTWYVLRNQATLSLDQIEKLRKTLKLDIIKPPKNQNKDRGTTLGGHTIRVFDKDKFPAYEFSKTLLGNARPVQPFGTRKLWTTPAKM